MLQEIDLQSYIEKWENGDLDSAFMATLYTLSLASLKFKGDFLQRKTSLSEKIDLSKIVISHESFTHLLENYKFKKMKPYVGEVLLRWLKGDWQMELLDHIPSPLEVLRIQAQGKRPVTMLVSSKRFFKPVLHKEDTLTFLTHDLEHAFKMNHDPHGYKLQVNFFKRIEGLIESSTFAESLESYLSDDQFKKDFDYLLSDMNTHPFHSLKFFKGFILSYFLRLENSSTLSTELENKYQHLSSSIAQALFTHQKEQEAFLLLNTKDFDNEHMPLLLTKSFENSAKMSPNAL